MLYNLKTLNYEFKNNFISLVDHLNVGLRNFINRIVFLSTIRVYTDV